MTRKSARQRQKRTEPTNETRHLIEGHRKGENAFYAARNKGTGWAVVDNNGGDRLPDFWTGTEWLPLHGDEPDEMVYRFTETEAAELAEHYAAVASEVHTRQGSGMRPEFTDWLAGKTEHLVAAVREQVSA